MAHPALRPADPTEKEEFAVVEARRLFEKLKSAGAQKETLDPETIIMSTNEKPKVNT